MKIARSPCTDRASRAAKALGYDVNKLPVDTDLERLRDDMEDLKRGLEDQTREVALTYGDASGAGGDP